MSKSIPCQVARIKSRRELQKYSTNDDFVDWNGRRWDEVISKNPRAATRPRPSLPSTFCSQCCCAVDIRIHGNTSLHYSTQESIQHWYTLFLTITHSHLTQITFGMSLPSRFPPSSATIMQNYGLFWRFSPCTILTNPLSSIDGFSTSRINNEHARSWPDIASHILCTLFRHQSKNDSKQRRRLSIPKKSISIDWFILQYTIKVYQRQ